VEKEKKGCIIKGAYKAYEKKKKKEQFGKKTNKGAELSLKGG